MMTLILGVTLGSVLATATFIVALGVWLVYRRRRRRQQATQTTAADRRTRLDPETTENRRNESSSLPQNNAVTSACSRYSKDGTLVLTVTNNCTGNDGNNVTMYAGRASDAKNGKAAACTSPRKPSISTVSDDVTGFCRTTTDDVNVWPYSSADDCQASALWDVQHDDDWWRPRRGSSDSGCADATKYHRKYPHKAKSLADNDECQSFRSCSKSRFDNVAVCSCKTIQKHVTETGSRTPVSTLL